MRTLLVMRHAKSAWSKAGEADVPDLERPLTGKGKRDAATQGAALKRQGLLPDAVLVSPAKRARSTAKQVVNASGYAGALAVDERLYSQGAQNIVKAIIGWPHDVQCGLVIGHNPDMSDLVHLLTGKEVILGTAHIAHITIKVETWQELQDYPTCRLVAVLTPEQD